ncbi:MAG: Pycsar system effector family protein, partial [Bacteroidota bacterium]
MEDSDLPIQVKTKKKKKKKGGRSTETMFRTMLTNLVRLSNMADQKAGLMISVNSIIVSLVVSFLFNRLTESRELLLPTFLLLLICLVTIIYSILATRPSVDKNIVNEADLLFFGHFGSFSLEDYVKSMRELVSDEYNLQNKMIGNIYAQGRVLEKKYQYLKIAYTVFMV